MSLVQQYVLCPSHVNETVWDFYKKAVASFWTVEEVDLSQDERVGDDGHVVVWNPRSRPDRRPACRIRQYVEDPALGRVRDQKTLGGALQRATERPRVEGGSVRQSVPRHRLDVMLAQKLLQRRVCQ